MIFLILGNNNITIELKFFSKKNATVINGKLREYGRKHRNPNDFSLGWFLRSIEQYLSLLGIQMGFK